MLSIIIPVYNENTGIIAFLSTLQKRIANSSTISEIILVDGGSSDGTFQTVEEYLETYSGGLKIKLYQSKKSRALQQNIGAKHATGSILFFLFADCMPAQGFEGIIKKHITTPQSCGVCRFTLSQGKRFTHMLEPIYNKRWLYRRRFGDSGIIVPKNLFDTIGGFDNTKQIEEGHELIMKLYKHGDFTILPIPLSVSDRAFRKNGYISLYLVYISIHLLYCAGIPEKSLVRLLRRYPGVKK